MTTKSIELCDTRGANTINTSYRVKDGGVVRKRTVTISGAYTHLTDTGEERLEDPQQLKDALGEVIGSIGR